MNKQRGYALLETLLAIGLAAIFMSSIIALALISNRGSAKAMQYQKASWAAMEGIEALRSMDFSDLFLTQYGDLSFVSNQWSLSENAPQIINSEMTRTIKIEEVQRNESCEIVSYGGEVDSNSFFIESEVSWVDASLRSQTITQRTLRTNWKNLGDTCAQEAASLVDIDVVADASWYGQKQLRDVHITNNGSTGVTIKEITFWWDNGELIEQVFLGAGKIWGHAGPGSPLGKQVSGTELETVETTIDSGQTLDLHKVQFTNNMLGTTITIKVKFTDDSEITTDPFVPSY